MFVLEVLGWWPFHFLETRLEAGDPVPVVSQLSVAVDVKSPFDLDRAVRSIREAVRPFPKAALFELVDEGFGSPFEILIACIISIRTRDEVSLLAFRGVGPKCANLALGVGCGQPRIGVDIHVHRVTNRWGYVQAGTPEQTMRALEAKLPRAYWVEINALLVPFGKHICTGSLPHCSTCVVLDMCRQVGVGKHR